MERFGQYILLEKVASGGMAELFKAKKLGIEGFERLLAIKRILPHLSSDDEFIEMFIAEAKLIARLSHKNIAQVYDFGKTDQNYFIAMEYIRGKDLKAILKKCQERNINLPVALAVFIAKEAAAALSCAHGQKDAAGKNLDIIHRDVSPQNILISYEGEVKVVDFGIAKATTHAKTTTGLLKGKLAYMSPEQAWGKAIDQRSDLFSLGIVLYEMLTGLRLFKGDTEINTLEKVREAKIEALPSFINADVPSDLEAKTLKALEKEAADRYQLASDMEAELGDTLFKLLSVDPSHILRRFMQDLFRAEIEEEQKAEKHEDTISIQHKQEYTSSPGQREEQKLLPARRVYPYIITVSLALVIIVATVLFWPRADEKATVQAPQQPPAHKTEQIQVNSEPKKQESKIQKVVEEESYGGLTVNAIPWANISISGKSYGTTPITLDNIKAGIYSVKLENPKFPDWDTKITISKGKTTKIAHRFSGFGTLVVNATPWGKVYMDGSLIGQTPLTLDKIPTRKHEIKVSREGYEDFIKTFDMKEGETERISVRLNKESE